MQQSDLHQDLIRRYLIWCYKTTRESFERIERKTTQIQVDEFLLSHLNQNLKLNKDDKKFIDDFKKYISTKKADEINQKYTSSQKKTFNPQYLYLKNRLLAIEEAVKYFLGKSELKKIKKLFEAEFTQRIMNAKEH